MVLLINFASRVACAGATSVAVAVLIPMFRSIALIRASHVHRKVAEQAPFGSGWLAIEIGVFRIWPAALLAQDICVGMQCL